MRDGRIQQVDTPQALYRFPTNLFVAAFIGSPAMNIVEARVDDGAVEFGAHRLALSPGLPGPTAERVVLGIRPESFQDAAFADPALPQLEAEVAVVEDLGSDTYVIFTVEAPRVDTEDVRETREDEEEGVLLSSDRAIFTARVDPRTVARVGTTLRLAVDTAGFHYFDPASGANVGRTTEGLSPAESQTVPTHAAT
jgi:multiple sugar transport system ATP-binding protein